MSLDKAIEHGKEKRKPYTGAQAKDRTCRNHGSCEWCLGNRQHHNRVEADRLDQRMEEFEKESYIC